MKTLPDHANLDHLRRQAKDLLAGLRDSEPGTSLADAQAALAGQYGFRTWADLKAEVDHHSRADVAPAGLAQQIAARFALGSVRGEMRSYARPDESGRRWLLETDRGRFAPRTVDDVYPPTDGEQNTRFQEQAARAGVLLPAPVRSVDGAASELILGNRWRVYESPRSGPPLAAPVSATITYEVGRLLAILHGLAFPAPGICPWNAGRLTGASWPELADRAHAKAAPWAPLLTAAVPTLVGLGSLGGGTETRTPVLCHNNFNPGNVRMGSAGRLVITGWEHAAGLPPEWELAATLTRWTVDPDGGVNVAGARALLTGYGAEPGGLTLASFHGAATALQNYVAGQLDLALEAAGPGGVRYADRNVRHLLTHLPSRSTFEQLLEVQV
uniref:phosphotransferase n=1 Tax=Paractinoplanes polyasparticus TaxID=2856853 RepID=UPI001C8582A6|nr:phosphotransferase [Actinoplanes polyasparticus]